MTRTAICHQIYVADHNRYRWYLWCSYISLSENNPITRLPTTPTDSIASNTATETSHPSLNHTSIEQGAVLGIFIACTAFTTLAAVVQLFPIACSCLAVSFPPILDTPLQLETLRVQGFQYPDMDNWETRKNQENEPDTAGGAEGPRDDEIRVETNQMATGMTAKTKRDGYEAQTRNLGR
ncbi:hypothetical protein BJ165DRAFT_1598234 [Panaeolus papilionaceus]|nr:hypothetical protein BJ165DRAFT_1598234 [Panaeolus papilionaceus]